MLPDGKLLEGFIKLVDLFLSIGEVAQPPNEALKIASEGG